MSCKRIAAIAGFGLVLAGCNSANAPIAEVDPFLGEAVKYNSAAMIIDPDPVYPEGSAEPGDNGDKMANAVKRYRTDKVKAIESQNTSTTGITSGPGPK